MQIEIIHQPHAVRLLIRLHLLQIPRHKSRVGVRDVIAADVAAVLCREEIGAPAPQNRAQRFGGRIGLFDSRRIGICFVAQLVVGGGQRMHVAMGAVPQHRLIVEIVEQDAAVGRRAVAAGQVIDPARNERRSDRYKARCLRVLCASLAPKRCGELPRTQMNPCWRRGRDSNPRYPCEYAAFRVRCFQPLSHLS